MSVNFKQSSNGFTLIELIIVIVILGVLAALISGNFITSLKKGRDAKRKADLEQIQRAIEMRYEDKKEYPDFATFPFGSKLCETESCAPGEKVYMQKVPNDPVTSKTYEYVPIPDENGYKLFACMENGLQILPYQAQDSGLTCSVQCEYSGSQVPCLWGISSSNISIDTNYP